MLLHSFIYACSLYLLAMSAQETDWDAVAFVISSRYRKEALEALGEQPQIPSEIGKSEIAHISRALQDLREEGLVDLLVSEDRKKGRVYGLTEKGREVFDNIESRE